MLKKIISTLTTAVLVLSMVACSATTSTTENGKFPEGKWVGEAEGYNKATPIQVEVVTTADGISEVNILQQAETEGIGAAALPLLAKQVVEKQTSEVDLIADATVTSEAFIKAVNNALEKAGIDPSTLGNSETSSAEEQVIDTDVVIIGAGGAGLSAAIEAADAGKSVVILEKASLTGGNTTRATGGMNAAETPEQDKNEFEESAGVEKTIQTAKKSYPELADLTATVEKQYEEYKANPEGYFDSVELFMLDTLVGGKNLNDHDLVKVLAEQSDDGIEWLKTVGANLSSVGAFGGASVERIHKPVNDEGKTVAVGSYMIPILTKACEDRNINIIYNAAATEIITTDGVVTGVKAEGYTVNAKSVVIATGGFGANLDLVVEYKPDLEGFVTTNAGSITGDGILMAQAVGADTVDMDQIQIHPTVEQSTSALITEGLRGDGAILVNAEGKRFTDEVGTRDAVSAAEVAQTGGYAYLIVDQAMVDASAVIQGYINKGLTVSGETYEELAEAMGTDGATFAATMETWNKAVESKKDAEFGRTSFANPLNTAPYYAIKIAPGVHHTMGGIKINTNAEVIDTEGNVIPNLYAAGEVTGGVHGANRLGGNAVSDIVVFGRIAGQNAAANVK